jgi:nucleoside ABC transporter membrane protein
VKVVVKQNPSPSVLANVIAFVGSLGAAMLVAAIILWSQGVNPWYAYARIFTGAFGSFYGWSETLTKAIPLMLCGLGLAVAFRSSFWNIGAEGQLLLGATAATGVALFVPVAGSLVLPLMILAGFLAGAAWGLLPAIFKGKLGANEVITTLMMNYIAIELVKYLVTGPWKGAKQFGFPYTDRFPSAAQLPILEGTRVHYSTLIIGIALAILLYVILRRTKLGYKIRVIGDNPHAAQYAGISYTRTILAVMIISGGLAGIAGVGEVAGVRHLLTTPEQISQGYGFTAIIVAWIAMRKPLAVIASSIFMGGLLVGGDVFQTSLGLPFQTINIFQWADPVLSDRGLDLYPLQDISER